MEFSSTPMPRALTDAVENKKKTAMTHDYKVDTYLIPTGLNVGTPFVLQPHCFCVRSVKRLCYVLKHRR